MTWATSVTDSDLKNNFLALCKLAVRNTNKVVHSAF